MGLQGKVRASRWLGTMAIEAWRSFAYGMWALLLLLTGAVHAATYVYDAGGHVVAITQTTASAQYGYDTLGHLAQITPVAANALALFAFAPPHGAPGTVVTLYGQGFSATASADSVAFNGTKATVSSASATVLTVKVPTGATTGPIAVTVGTATAVSSATFVVDDSGAPPTISQVSPTVASVGTTITVKGTHLDPPGSAPVVTLAGTPVALTTLADTQLQFVVPAGAPSGTVQVRTLYGTATSAAFVVILPSTVTPSQVVQDTSVSVNGSATSLTIPSGGQAAIVTFQGTTGSWLSLQASQIVSVANNINYSVYSPSNTLLAQGTLSVSSATAHLPQLRASGTYWVLITPDTAGASLAVSLETNQTLAATPISVAAAAAGQSKRLIFNATQGQNLELTLSDVVAASNYPVMVTVTAANGTVLVNNSYCNPATAASCRIALWNLAAGGYTVTVAPYSGTDQISFQAQLQPDTAGGALSANTPVAVSLGAGQVIRYTFSANAGDTVALALSGVSTTDGGGLYADVYRPDTGIPNGSNRYTSLDTQGASTLNLSNLPAGGTYTVVVYTVSGTPATAKLGEYTNAVASANATLPTTGVADSYGARTAGQAVSFGFNATQGQNLELTLSDVVAASNNPVMVTVTAANGTVLVNNSYCNPATAASCRIALWNLAAGGYTVTVAPNSGTDQISFQAQLQPDALATLGANTPVTVGLGMGQVNRYTFSANQGDTVALALSGVSTTDGQGLYADVYRPDTGIPNGSNRYTSLNTSGSSTLNLSNLPAKGTYTVVVYTLSGAPATAQLAKYSGALLTYALQSHAATVAGASIVLPFAPTAGQNLQVVLSNLAITGSTATSVPVSIIDPNNNTVATTTCPVITGVNCALTLWNPVAGTYLLQVSAPDAKSVLSFNTSLVPQVNAP